MSWSCSQTICAARPRRTIGSRADSVVCTRWRWFRVTAAAFAPESTRTATRRPLTCRCRWARHGHGMINAITQSAACGCDCVQCARREFDARTWERFYHIDRVSSRWQRTLRFSCPRCICRRQYELDPWWFPDLIKYSTFCHRPLSNWSNTTRLFAASNRNGEIFSVLLVMKNDIYIGKQKIAMIRWHFMRFYESPARKSFWDVAKELDAPYHKPLVGARQKCMKVRARFECDNFAWHWRTERQIAETLDS